MCARRESAQELPAGPRGPAAFVTRLPRHGAVLRPRVTLWLTISASESLQGEPGAGLAARTPDLRVAGASEGPRSPFPGAACPRPLLPQTEPFRGRCGSSASARLLKRNVTEVVYFFHTFL